MPIRLLDPPESALEAVRSALDRRLERKDFTTPTLRAARADELYLAAPHPVHALGLRALAEGQGLEAAELTGWRYLVQRRERTIASAELHGADPGTPEARALELNEGPFVRATETAIDDLAERPELAEATYELRLLRIPAVYVIALWLRAADGDGDLLVPIGETPPEVEAGRLYRPEELFSALQEQARRQLEFDSSPGEGSQAQ
jgi:hypothetical protein